VRYSKKSRLIAGGLLVTDCICVPTHSLHVSHSSCSYVSVDASPDFGCVRQHLSVRVRVCATECLSLSRLTQSRDAGHAMHHPLNASPIHLAAKGSAHGQHAPP